MTDPQPRGGGNHPHGTDDGAHTSDDAPDPARTPAGTPRPPGGAPWDAAGPRPPGPAPVIELDSPVDPGPVKPLGPRRLARLQREMAEHHRQVQEAEQRNAGQVDEDLLIKQQRFAQLAMRAAAANEQDRRDADAAVRAARSGTTGPRPSGAGSSGAHPSGTEKPEGSEGGGGGPVEVVFPPVPTVGSPLAVDPVHADPAQLPSSPLAPSGGPETTQLHLFTGVVPAVPAPPPPAPDAGQTVPETAAGPEREGASRTPADPVPPAEPRESASHAESAENTAETEVPGGSARAEPTGSAAPAGAAPVRAVDAEGLELLDPRDYTRRSGALVALLIALAVVLAALVVVLIVFVL